MRHSHTKYGIESLRKKKNSNILKGFFLEMKRPLAFYVRLVRRFVTNVVESIRRIVEGDKARQRDLKGYQT